jgi:predicted RNase H-like HicB family nuclease
MRAFLFPVLPRTLRWYNPLGLIDRRAAFVITYRLTAVIARAEAGYVSRCPELDIASQRDSIEEARANLQEALELFFETASEEEIRTRLSGEVYVTSVEVAVG